jgi:hypothetical protein
MNLNAQNAPPLSKVTLEEARAGQVEVRISRSRRLPSDIGSSLVITLGENLYCHLLSLGFPLLQRARLAFLAISRRFSGVNARGASLPTLLRAKLR